MRYLFRVPLFLSAWIVGNYVIGWWLLFGDNFIMRVIVWLWLATSMSIFGGMAILLGLPDKRADEADGGVQFLVPEPFEGQFDHITIYQGHGPPRPMTEEEIDNAQKWSKRHG